MGSNETSAAKKRHCVVFILHLCLHVFDRVTWLHMQVDGISVKSAQQFAFHHKDEGPNEESIPLLDIVIRTGLSILELLSRKDQTLLVYISFSMLYKHIFVSDLHESSIRRNLIRRDSCEGGLSHADLGVGGEEIALHVSCGVPLHTSCRNSTVPVSC